MGAAGSTPLVVQTWQRNPDRPNHAYANPETRRQLKDKLLAGAIDPCDLLGASEVNPGIKSESLPSLELGIRARSRMARRTQRMLSGLTTACMLSTSGFSLLSTLPAPFNAFAIKTSITSS